MRRTVARRLTESVQTIPHFNLTIDVEIDKLLDLRRQVNAADESYKVSVNDFVLRACALALQKVPEVNASWTDAALIQHAQSDVAMAVAIEGGLITPIIFGAQNKSVVQIARETKDLAERARARKLKSEEYQGGTFAVSNLGMFGVRTFNSIINPPHAAILSVGVGEQRPIARDGQLAVATIMSVTLAIDHRVLGGAEGARWLQAFKQLIETPIRLVV
jgi:pyruvate dehydrogenase E2 component (dihydrolipoamide acetyltransferase)